MATRLRSLRHPCPKPNRIVRLRARFTVYYPLDTIRHGDGCCSRRRRDETRRLANEQRYFRGEVYALIELGAMRLDRGGSNRIFGCPTLLNGRWGLVERGERGNRN